MDVNPVSGAGHLFTRFRASPSDLRCFGSIFPFASDGTVAERNRKSPRVRFPISKHGGCGNAQAEVEWTADPELPIDVSPSGT